MIYIIAAKWKQWTGLCRTVVFFFMYHVAQYHHNQTDNHVIFHQRTIKTASCSQCCAFFCHSLLLTRLDKSKVALFVLLYQAGSSWPLVFNTHYSGTRCPFASGTTFKLTRSPQRMGGWIGGRQNLWLIASLMWQGPAVWGNWSARRVDTFCVLLSCRLLLAWPWGPGIRPFTLQTLRGQHQLFYCGYWLSAPPPCRCG